MTKTSMLDLPTIAEHASSGPLEDQGMGAPLLGQVGQRGVPDDAWMRCDGCGAMLFRRHVARNLNVCPECDCHFPVSAVERIHQFLDADTFEEWYADLMPADPLGFNDTRSYAECLLDARERTGMSDAVLVGQGLLQGARIVFAVIDGGFMMGSIGCVVGEKITRAVEEATRRELPLVLVSDSSAEARVHEGTLSLIQMAKISAALARHHAAGGPCISVLGHSTTRGAATSFVSHGDVNLAEPMPLVRHTASKCISRTIHGHPGGGFQMSEFLQDHGYIDRVVHRRDLRDTVIKIIDYIT